MSATPTDLAIPTARLPTADVWAGRAALPRGWQDDRFARTWLAALAAALAVVLGGCAMPATQPGLSDLLARPAERALLLGLRAYDDAQYPEAEKQLTAALRAGLGSVRDQANAQKHLAFIYCTSDRLQPCEQAFVAARRADAAFTLTRSEAGHPVWGPVYRRVLP